jgi:hypothetical protein
MANPVQRIALYARVSTSNGHQDPEMQLRELREYAERRNLTVAGEYIDRMTGSKDSRPSLNRLMAEAAQRRFDAVLVWKLDRFGRSLRHLVNALAELEALGWPSSACPSAPWLNLNAAHPGARKSRFAECPSKGEKAWPSAGRRGRIPD